MKYERCPKCKGRLGIPDKRRGQPVECPVCHLEFVPLVRDDSTNASSAQPANTGGFKKPGLRALPVPAAIADNVHQLGSDKSTIGSVTNGDPLMPPVKSRLSVRAPAPREGDAPDLGLSQPGTIKDSNKAVDQDSDVVEAKISGVKPYSVTSSETDTSNSAPPTVAKIIKSEFVQPLLNKEGNLPTLQLNDDAEPKPKDVAAKSNPVFLTLLICVSLLSSALMLFLVGLQPATSQKAIDKAREKVREFYEVRVDEELAPYQRELREAQLAHSRGDHKSEIRSYQQVMSRFHAEDHSQFTGLTGSPTWDIELEEHVSILLNEAKRNSKQTRR